MDPYEHFLGLKPSGRRPDHYELLGVARSETDAEALLKATERRLAQVSAERNRQNSVLANRLMQEIVAARACLSSPESRLAYDQSLKPTDHAPKPPAISTGSKRSVCPPITRLPVGKTAARPGIRRLRVGAAIVVVLVGGFGIALVIWLSNDSRQSESSPSPTEVAQAESAPAPDDNSPAASEQSPPVPEQDDDNNAEASAAPHPPAQATPTDDQSADEQAPRAQADELDRITLGRILEQSTVRISVAYPGAHGATGLGVVVDPSGLVATCCDLIAGASSADVEFKDGSRLPVLGIRAMAPEKNLIILHVAINDQDVRAIAWADQPAKPQDTCFGVRFATPKHLSAVPLRVQSLFQGTELNRRIPNIAKGDVASFANELTCLDVIPSVTPTTSGGPIVDTRGQLVAIAMWVGNVSSGAPVVVSALDLRLPFEQSLLAAVSPLNGLDPRTVAGFDASQLRPVDVAQGWDSVTLPSGNVVDARIGIVPDRELRELTREPSQGGREAIPSFFVHTFESGEVQGIYRHVEGKLHGTSVILHKDGQLKIVGEYDSGKRIGDLKYWANNEQLIFSSQYKAGREDGLVCTYRDARPWLVQECDNGRVRKTHLVTFVEDSPVLSTFDGDNLPPATNEHLEEALAHLNALKQSLDDDESMVRRETYRWYNDIYKELQRQAITARSPQIRAAQSKRRAQQQEAANEVINRLRRLHGIN